MVVGQAMHQRRTGPTTENHSPPPVGDILIDHWGREIVHGCWSGDAPEAHRSNNGREAHKLRPDLVGTHRSNNGLRGIHL